ncbi:hypothetical protein LJC44_01230 [Parabacteroides sp. OttesenSCG-928-G06]|nr:hypothetical protein [Parabacteroides sp. OttesenSCG-928-K15]MDL2281726.1 hypothetical protein [Parabacteroides sp. OttesenSCG-928-G06]
MKRYWKEIVLALIIVGAAIILFWYFFGSIKTEQKSADINLLSIVAGDPQKVIVVNRPQALSIVNTEEIFAAYIPEIYLSLIAAFQHSILSFHAEGIVFYTKLNSQEIYALKKKILPSRFGGHPVKQQKKDITYFFYPDTAYNYFGYYIQDGIIVASHSRHLLEEVSREQADIKTSVFDSIKVDANIPINLLLSPGTLDLKIETEDSLIWQMPQQWTVADIIFNEEKVCMHLSLKKESVTDSLFYSVTDSISYRLETLFPTATLDTQATEDEEFLYYTGCLSLE